MREGRWGEGEEGGRGGVNISGFVICSWCLSLFFSDIGKSSPALDIATACMCVCVHNIFRIYLSYELRYLHR